MHVQLYYFLYTFQVQGVSKTARVFRLWCVCISIYYASVLAAGGNPSDYRFDQTSMRAHMHKCLKSDKFSPFPAQKLGRKMRKKVQFSNTIDIFCTCRMPKSFNNNEMILCDKCLQWFHLNIYVLLYMIVARSGTVVCVIHFNLKLCYNLILMAAMFEM